MAKLKCIITLMFFVAHHAYSIPTTELKKTETYQLDAKIKDGLIYYHYLTGDQVEFVIPKNTRIENFKGNIEDLNDLNVQIKIQVQNKCIEKCRLKKVTLLTFLSPSHNLKLRSLKKVSVDKKAVK